MKPVVTIGVCVRNSALTLKEAIDSIIAQNFPHELMEVVFVDDDSTDTTLSIINDSVENMNIQTKVFHHKWKGLGLSRNLVFKNAEGKYIIWVDGDMILPADHVQKQVEFMEKNPEIGIAKARYGILEDETLVCFLENISYVAADFVFGGRSTDRPLGTGGSIYRVNAIRMIGGFDVYISGVGEDIDFENRLRKSGWLLFLGSPAIFYERRRASLTSVWKEGLWHGYGGYHIFRKNRHIFALYKMSPLAGLVAGVWYATVAYKITRRKLAFLLPFQYTFKRVAWCFGFIKAQLAI